MALEAGDIIPQSAVDRVALITKELEDLYMQMKKIAELSIGLGKAIKEGTSTEDIAKNIDYLTQKEKELIKVQNQISVALAKQNDEYMANKKALVDLNKVNQDRLVLGDKDARQVTAANSSLTQLEAALKKNRVAYAALRTEQERSSKSAKDLLAIVQKQAIESDSLRKSMMQNKEAVVNVNQSFDAMDQLTGNLIGSFKNMGKQLMIVATNPFFLAIAGAVALFKALQASADYYYTSTLKGEEAAKKSGAVWDAFFETFREGNQKLGEDVVKSNKAFNTFFSNLLVRLGVEEGVFSKEADAAVKNRERIQAAFEDYYDKLNVLFREHLRDVVDDANTELKINKLLEDSKNKLLLTDEQRLQAVRLAGKEAKKQLEGDIKLADGDIEAQEQLVKIRQGKIAIITEEDRATGKLITRNKTIAEMSDEEINDTKLIGEELKKLADLQVARINLESKASVQSKSFRRIEIGIVQEIEKVRVDSLRRVEDSRMQLGKQNLENDIKENEKIIKLSASTADEQLGIENALYNQRIQLLTKNKQEELTVIKRSAEDRLKEEAQIFANNELEKNADLTAKDLIRIQNEKLATLVANDKTYQNEVKTANAKFNSESLSEAQAYADAVIKIKQNEIKEELTGEMKKLDGQIQLIKQAAIEGKKSKEQADKEILDLQKKSTDDYIQLQIDALQKTLMLDGLSVEERKKLEEQLYKLKVDLQNAFFNQLESGDKKLQVLIGKIYDVYSEFSKSVGDLFHTITQNRLNDIDREEKALDDQTKNSIDRLKEDTDARIEAAAGNAEAIAAINRGADKEQKIIEEDAARRKEVLEHKKIEAQRKAAIFDKATSAVQAAIATALAVTKLLATPPLAVAAGIAGAIEVAAILARQIPQFAEGGIHEGGLMIVGEEGSEAMHIPGQGMFMSPDVPTLMSAPSGTEIWNHDETMRALAFRGLSTVDERQPTQKEYEALVKLGKKLDSLEHTMRTKKEVHHNWSKRGVETMIKHSEHRIKILNDLFD